MKTTIYENIKKCCEKQNVSINKVERDLGFARSTFNKWRKSNPTVDNIKKVADYLGVSIYDLIE